MFRYLNIFRGVRTERGRWRARNSIVAGVRVNLYSRPWRARIDDGYKIIYTNALRDSFYYFPFYCLLWDKNIELQTVVLERLVRSALTNSENLPNFNKFQLFITCISEQTRFSYTIYTFVGEKIRVAPFSLAGHSIVSYRHYIMAARWTRKNNDKNGHNSIEAFALVSPAYRQFHTYWAMTISARLLPPLHWRN